jgi:hypothetical protein
MADSILESSLKTGLKINYLNIFAALQGQGLY